jgi:glycosyltransferase involved in cell wall biosynthesis
MDIKDTKNKPKVALMTYAFDNRQAKGTALYARKLTNLLIKNDQFDFFLVHYDKVDDPIYKIAKEIIMPNTSFPFANHFIRQMLFFWQYRKSKFDIIHWFQPRLYPFFWFAPANKIVVTAHGAADITSLTTKSSFVLSREIFNFLMVHFNNFISAVIAVSKFGRDEVVEHYKVSPEKVFSIYNGGSEDFRPLDKKECQKLMKEKYKIESPFILDISRLEPHKNVISLILAYIHLRNHSQIRHKLIIVGNQAFGSNNIIETAKRSQYNQDIIFIDYIDMIDLNSLYVAADLFVFPSLNEGFGLPVVESMASGTPVLTSNVTALPEIGGEAVEIIDPLNIVTMAEKMNSILSSTDRLKILSEKGISRAKDFVWQKTAKETVDLYVSLLKS